MITEFQSLKLKKLLEIIENARYASTLILDPRYYENGKSVESVALNLLRHNLRELQDLMEDNQ